MLQGSLGVRCVLAPDVISGDKPHLATRQLSAPGQVLQLPACHGDEAPCLEGYEAPRLEGLLGEIHEMAVCRGYRVLSIPKSPYKTNTIR